MTSCESNCLIDARIQVPFSFVLCGASSTGKSTWLKNFLLNIDRLTTSRIDHIILLVGSTDNTLTILKESFGERMLILTQIDQLENHVNHNKEVSQFIILDDLQDSVVEHDLVTDIYTKHSHHDNISIAVILQDVFLKGSNRLTIFRNANHLVIFRSPLDNSVLQLLARRISGSGIKSNEIVKLIEIATKKYGYLFVTGHVRSDPNLLFRTDLFNPSYQICYLPS